MALSSHLQELKRKHQTLSDAVEEAQRAPGSSDLEIADMKKQKLIDEIVKEPLGGAHSNREEIFTSVRDKILENYKELKNLSPEDLIEKRMDKYANMGVFKG